MALAFLYPEPEKGGRGKKSEAKTAAKRGGFSSDRVDTARAVLRHSVELAEQVRDGDVTLDDALKIVHEQIAQTSELIDNTAPRMRKLRRERPDGQDHEC